MAARIQQQAPAGVVLTIGTLGSHSLHLMESGQNIDQLNPIYFPLELALSQSVANPLYQSGGVGALGTPTVSRAQLLLPFPQYTSVKIMLFGDWRQFLSGSTHRPRMWSRGICSMDRSSVKQDQLGKPEWFGIRQITLYASISERTVRAWIHSPTDPLAAVRVRGKILVRRSELDAWLLRHPVPSLEKIDLDGIVKGLLYGRKSA